MFHSIRGKTMYLKQLLCASVLICLVSCSLNDPTKSKVTSSSSVAVSSCVLALTSSSVSTTISSSVQSSAVIQSSSLTVQSSSLQTVLSSSSSMVGCYGQDSMLPTQSSGKQPVNQSGLCCQGLNVIQDNSFFDITCKLIILAGTYVDTRCSACGNGICDKTESHCNCPADCP